MQILTVDESGLPKSIALVAHFVLDGLPGRFQGTLNLTGKNGSGRATLFALPSPL
jgi:hypothetical protein